MRNRRCREGSAFGPRAFWRSVRTLGFGVLGVGVVLPWAYGLLGPWTIFLSWAAAAAGLVLLRREPELRRAATLGLVILVALVVAALAGAGVTMGRGGQVVAQTAALDPSIILVTLGLVAALLAAAALVALVETRRRQKLAWSALVLGAIAAASFVAHELARVGAIARPFFGVTGSATQMLLAASALLLGIAYVRLALRAAPTA